MGHLAKMVSPAWKAHLETRENLAKRSTSRSKKHQPDARSVPADLQGNPVSPAKMDHQERKVSLEIQAIPATRDQKARQDLQAHPVHQAAQEKMVSLVRRAQMARKGQRANQVVPVKRVNQAVKVFRALRAILVLQVNLDVQASREMQDLLGHLATMETQGHQGQLVHLARTRNTVHVQHVEVKETAKQRSLHYISLFCNAATIESNFN